MAIKGDKKLLGAYLLEILKKETDINYSKTIEDIIEEIFGTNCPFFYICNVIQRTQELFPYRIANVSSKRA